ncbi:SIR2 family protein [bacterium]|nr:SIR2 family protein [bacterium]
MVTEPTVLILGAGASKPYRFPLGAELRDEVLRVKWQEEQYDELKHIGIDPDHYGMFEHVLRRSGAASVDAFLEDDDRSVQEGRFLGIGKAAMAYCMLQAERKTREHLFPPNQPADHWYQSLWGIIKAPTWEEYCAQPLAIVTFNYDRSLEFYLSEVINFEYSMHPVFDQSEIPIMHVHGSLGPFSSETYGSGVSPDLIDAAVNSIRVVHEAHIEDSEFQHVRTMITSATKVLFVGFGYADANMKKLGIPEGLHRQKWGDNPQILGTHKGINAPRWRRLCDQLRFSPGADKTGGGKISAFIEDRLH